MTSANDPTSPLAPPQAREETAIETLRNAWQRSEADRAILLAEKAAAERARDEARKERDEARRLMEWLDVQRAKHINRADDAEATIARLTAQLQEAQRKLITDPMLHDPDCAIFGSGHRPKCDCVRPQLAAVESQLTALRASVSALHDDLGNAYGALPDVIEAQFDALSAPLDPQTKDRP